jgi:hypothetical protein
MLYQLMGSVALEKVFRLWSVKRKEKCSWTVSGHFLGVWGGGGSKFYFGLVVIRAFSRQALSEVI